MNRRNAALLLLLLGTIPGILPGVEDGKTIRTTAYSLQRSENPAKDFISSDPCLNVVWEPEKKGGRGTLVIRIRKGGKKKNWLGCEIKGPMLKQEPSNAFISRRELHVNATLEVSGNLAPHGFRISYLDKTGKGASSWDERKQGYHCMFGIGANPGKFSRKTTESQFGTVNNPSCGSGFLRLFVDPERGPAEIRISDLEITEAATYSHKIITPRYDGITFSDSAVIRIEPFRFREMSGGVVTAFDEENKAAHRMKIPVGRESFEFRIPDRGFYVVQVDARYQDGSLISSRMNTVTAGPKIPEELRKSSRFGCTGVYLPSAWAMEHGFYVTTCGWNNELNSMVREGSRGTLEYTGKPSRSFGGGLWGAYDKRWPDFNRDSMLHFAHFYANYPDCVMKPEHRGIAAKTHEQYPPDFARLREAVRIWAKHSRIMPQCVVVRNEPNAGWKGSREELAKLHNVVAEAVKSVRPEVKLGGPCLYNIDMPLFKELVKLGILENLDYLIMHAYVYSTAPEQEFIQKVIELQEFMKTTKYRNLPLVITEFGWCGEPGDWQKPIPQLLRAQYTSRAHILLTARNVQGLVLFAGLFKPNGGDRDLSYSMVKPDHTPFPVYGAMATILRELTAVREGGTILPLAPGVFGAVFKRNGSTISAFWTEDKTVSSLVMKHAPNYVRKMMGTLLKAERELSLGPSPVFAEFPGTALAGIRLTPVKPILPGETISFPGMEDRLLTPWMEQISPTTIRLRNNAPVGMYTIPVQQNGTWIGYRFEVVRLFSLTLQDVVWNGKPEEKPALKFSSVSRAGKTLSVEMELGLDDGRSVKRKLPHPPGKFEFLVEIPDSENGKRCLGTLVLRSEAPFFETSCQVDRTPLAIPFFRNGAGEKEWKKVSGIPLHHFIRKGEMAPKDLSPLKAELRICADPGALRMKVDVKDEVFLQTRRGVGIWKEDSIQAAFDINADDPWEINNFYAGYNGHRVVEYGFAKTPGKDAVQCFRWLSYMYKENLPIGPVPALAKLCRISRNDRTKTTHYDLVIPWKYLGFGNKLPDLSRRIGISILINDANRKGERRYLPYQFGIAPQKVIEKFERARFYEP